MKNVQPPKETAEKDSGPLLGTVYGEGYAKTIGRVTQYETGADFWRDTAAQHGKDEALGICGNYLSLQLKHEQPSEEHRFCRELFTAMYEDTADRAVLEKLVYPYPFQEADKRAEVSFYHENRRRNGECAHAVDEAINDSCYTTYHYNLDIAAMKVIHGYGFERVNMVLAHNLQVHGHDGRYSPDNKRWAQGFDIPEKAFDHDYMNAHPILIEDFTKYSREFYTEAGAKRFAPPGRQESGEMIGGYEITRSISFGDMRGFAIGHDPAAPDPYVCWQFTIEGGKRDFYWGHYFGSVKDAEKDYIARVSATLCDGNAKEIPSTLAAAEMSTKQDHDMIDGRINNEKQLGDSEGYQDKGKIRESAIDALTQDKSSVLARIRESKKIQPAPHKQKDGRGGNGDLER
jgi:hypothetical protein